MLLFCLCFFLSAVLQVWWTVCSSVLGYLISIHHLHHSRHSVEVTTEINLIQEKYRARFVLALCLTLFRLVVFIAYVCYHLKKIQ